MASVDDIRVTVAWRDHPKRQKLQRRLGSDGVLALLDLWLWAGANRPGGELFGMNEEDIEIACGWRGAPDTFVPALLDLRLLDLESDVYRMHDWQDHQRWASGAARRSEAARVANDVRWRDRNPTGQEPDKETAPAGRETKSGRNRPSPSPSPSPSRFVPVSGEAPPASALPSAFGFNELQAIWNGARLGLGVNADGFQQAEILAAKIRDTASARGDTAADFATRFLAAWPEMRADWARRNRAPKGSGCKTLVERFTAVVEWMDGGGREAITGNERVSPTLASADHEAEMRGWFKP